MAFPTKDQCRVINHRGRPLVVVAGPGTGKTRTLVERMIALLREDQSREVTFITFTRTSRHDTERKLEQALGEAVLERPGLVFPRTSTLHAYAKRLVHKYSHLIHRDPSFSVLIESKGERSIIIKELAADLGLAARDAEVSKAIAQFTATDEWPLDFSVKGSDRPAMLSRFDELLRLYKTFDMQGLVLAACDILQSAASALPKLFLQVDEYQDLNRVDQHFLNLLISHPSSEVAIVGDDAQSIYGLRYANYQGIRDLWQSDGWERIRFWESFRLPPHVLNAALDLIAKREYLGAKIHRKPDNGARITTLQCTADRLQIEAIACDIKTRIANARDGDRPALSFKDFLVLCPTNSKVQQAVGWLCDRFGVPAHTPSSSSIPDDYWSVVLLLRIADDSDPLALRQWLPKLGLDTTEISRLRDEALRSGMPFSWCCFSAGDPLIDHFQACIDRVRNQAETPASLLGALSRIDGVHIPPDFARLLDSAIADDGRLPPIARLLQIVYQHFGVLDPEEIVPEDDKVLVATMHSAKGLEAEFVYCAWMNSRFMPLEGRDPEEERRVLYVALTRAKQDVMLTYPEGWDQTRKRRLRREAMSPFLREIALRRLRIYPANAKKIRSDSPPWRCREPNAA